MNTKYTEPLRTILEILNLGLVILLLFRWIGWSESPLATIFTESDRLEDIHAPKAVENRSQMIFQRDGGTVTVEDIIRYLHAHPELIDTIEKRQTLQQMQQTQTALLSAEENLKQIEYQLNTLALEVYQRLTPAEQARIRSRRNTDSVEGIEAQYWQALIEQVGTEQ